MKTTPIATTKPHHFSIAPKKQLVLWLFLSLTLTATSQTFEWGLSSLSNVGWRSAAINQNGNTFMVGSTTDGMSIDGSSFTGPSGYVMLVNQAGHVEFLKKTSADINSVATDGNDNFFLAFNLPFNTADPIYVDTDTLTKETPSSKVLLAKYDHTGKRVWCVQYTPTSNTASHTLRSISDEQSVMITDHTGNVYLYVEMQGLADVSIGDTTILWGGGYALLKFNPDGKLLYYKKTTSYTGNGFTISNMTVDSYDNLYVTGNVQPYANKDYNKCDFGNGVILNYRDLLTTQYQIYTAKFNANGIAQWAHLTSDPHLTSTSTAFRTTDIVCDKNDAPHLVGIYRSMAVVFNGNETLQPYTGSSANNAFMVKYTSDGSYQWAKTYIDTTGKNKDSEIRQLRFGPNNAMYLFCLYPYRGFNLFGNILPRISTTGSSDRLVARLDSSLKLVWWKYLQAGELNNSYPRMMISDKNEIYLASKGFTSATKICTALFDGYYYSAVEDSIGKGSINGNLYFVKFGPESTTGIQSPTASQSRVFPNPVENTLYISNMPKADKVDIYSGNGQLIQSLTGVLPDKSGINVAQLAKGLYLAKVYRGNTVSVFRFMKQ